MEEEEQKQNGRLFAAVNPDKQPGDKRPAFRGDVTLEGEDAKRQAVLWALTTKAGRTMLAGRTAKSAKDQIDDLAQPKAPEAEPERGPQSDGKQFVVEAHELVLFENGGKTPDKPTLPDYWGYYNPGDGTPLRRLTVWANNDRNGRPTLSGTLSVHEPALELKRSRERHRGRGM